MKNSQRGGIRRFIALWIGAVLLSFALLIGGLLYAVPRLNAKTQRVFSDSQSLQTNQLFELALVAQGREDLRWHRARRFAPLVCAFLAPRKHQKDGVGNGFRIIIGQENHRRTRRHDHNSKHHPGRHNC